MAYQSDIFISYAHVDNESAFQGQNGWISDFHRALEVRVTQLLGRKPSVWRDPKLTGNDVFSEAITQQLPQTAVLVSVLSPRYVKSDWCKRELQSFWQACVSTTGLAVGTKARVFKVLKTPIKDDSTVSELQPLLQPLLGYEFYKLDPQSGHFHELDLAFGPDAKAEYWLRLDDLAQDIANLLERLSGGGEQVNGNKPVVYLAETTSDLKEAYLGLRRDLESRGNTVLPQRSLPLEEDDLKSFVRDQLSRCSMSVHLTGARYGVVPDGSEQSMVEMQNKLAAERAGGGFVRLVWLPPGVEPQDDRQRAFINRLRTDPGWNENSDLLETPIESLKAVINERLTAMETPPKKEPPATPEKSRPARVYLICDQQDQENVLALRDFLFEQGFEVLLPLFDGDETEVRLDHEDNLQTSDAAIIYHGLGSEPFLRRKLRELRKNGDSSPEGRSRVSVVCLAPPMTPAKQSFRTLEAILVQQNEGFSAAAWQPFLNQFRAKGVGAL